MLKNTFFGFRPKVSKLNWLLFGIVFAIGLQTLGVFSLATSVLSYFSQIISRYPLQFLLGLVVLLLILWTLFEKVFQIVAIVLIAAWLWKGNYLQTGWDALKTIRYEDGFRVTEIVPIEEQDDRPNVQLPEPDWRELYIDARKDVGSMQLQYKQMVSSFEFTVDSLQTELKLLKKDYDKLLNKQMTWTISK